MRIDDGSLEGTVEFRFKDYYGSVRSRWEKDGAVVRISVLFQPMVCEDFRECNQTHLQCLLTLMTLVHA